MMYQIIVTVLISVFSAQVQASQASPAELVKPKKAPLLRNRVRNEAEIAKLNTLFADEIAPSNNSAAIKVEANQTIPAAAEIKESYDKSAAQIENKADAQIEQTDTNELTALAKQYKDGIPVKDIPGISKVNLTKETLEHVFRMNIAEKSDKSKGAYLTGFHHDYHLQSENQKRPFYSSVQNVDDEIRELFIAMNDSGLFMFKTFFSPLLSKEQIIERLIESLNNIKKQENQPQDRLLIEGITADRLTIRTIINKKNGDIITFFPVSKKSKEEMGIKQERYKKLFKKFSNNFSQAPLHTPVTDKEITKLLEQFPKDIPFNMAVGKLDLLSPDLYKQYAARNLTLAPYYKDVLIREDQLPVLLKKYADRIIVKHIIKNVHFTREALIKIFSEKLNPNLPLHLTRAEQLHHVVEALQNLDKMIPRSTEKQFKNLMEVRRRDGLLYVKGKSKATEENSPFVYSIGINENTGDIEFFIPYFE